MEHSKATSNDNETLLNLLEKSVESTHDFLKVEHE
jgi:hypothetical protein